MDNEMSKKRLLIIQIICLVLVTLQGTAYLLVVRYSRGILKEDYIGSTLVLFAEVLKFVVSGVLMYNETKKSGGEFKSHVVKVFKSSYLLSPPALLYFCQNFLAIISLKNIRAPYYHVINQLKVLSTALLSVIILRRKLNYRKWISLVVLVVGVVMVTWRDDESDSTESNWIGYTTAFIIAMISGFSGVYVELFIKKKTEEFSIWDRNFQLAFYSIIFAFFSTFLFNYQQIFGDGFLHGYSIWAIISIILLGSGGLIIAMVIKYLNNIIKSFTIGIAIILGTIFSYFFWGLNIDLQFCLGVGVVISSVLLYSDLGIWNKIIFLKTENVSKQPIVEVDEPKKLDVELGPLDDKELKIDEAKTISEDEVELNKGQIDVSKQTGEDEDQV